MTTYTEINDTEIESGKPVTESLVTRLAKNVLAIQEGDPTAPKIQPNAIPDGLVTAVASVEGSGGLTLNFDHGEAAAHDVHITFSAHKYLFNLNNPHSVSLTVNGTTEFSADGLNVNGDAFMCAGVLVSLGSGSHTIVLNVPSGSGRSFLTAQVFKK